MIKIRNIRNAALILTLALAAGSTDVTVCKGSQTWPHGRATNLRYIPDGRPLSRDIRTLVWRPNQEFMLMETHRIGKGYPPMT